MTRVRVRLWRKNIYGVELLKWWPWPHWKLVDEYNDENKADSHARELASDGWTERLYGPRWSRYVGNGQRHLP